MTSIPYFDIFISYTSKSPASNLIQIKKLHKRLTEDYNFKVWLDILEQMKIENASKSIAEGIRDSKLIISCVTRLYSQSTIQQSELELAKEMNKPVIAIMLEELKLMDVPEIFTHIGHLRRLNLYSDQRGLRNWSGKIFEDIIQKIRHILEVSEKKAVNTKPQLTERKAAALPIRSNSLTIYLPKSTKQIVTKALDLFRLKNYSKATQEIDYYQQNMSQTQFNEFIDSIIAEYSELIESEQQQLNEIKTLNLNEHRVFYFDKISENETAKISLFIFKRKYNGRYQVYSCATKKFYDLKKLNEILKSLYILDNSKHTQEFIEERRLVSNKSISKAFIVAFLVEEMGSKYDEEVKIDWEKDFKLYPNESIVPRQRPQVDPDLNRPKNNLNEIGNKNIEANFNLTIKLPLSSQTVIEKCKELSIDFKTDRNSQAVKFEKNVIDSNNMENFINILLAKYPQATDNEKLSIHKLKGLNINEARSIFIEVSNLEEVKLILLIVKLSSTGHFKITSVENRNGLRLLDITEIFTYFNTIESQQSIELIQQLESIQSNKRINKCLIKYFLCEQFNLHFNENIEIQWEQQTEVKILTSNNEKFNNKHELTDQKAFENKTHPNEHATSRQTGSGYLNTLKSNQENLEELKKSFVHLKLSIDAKDFIEICTDFIKKNKLEPIYKQLECRTTTIKSAFINKYIEKLLDDFFYANAYEKESILGIKDLADGEKRSMFIETSTHVSSKFFLILCTRQSNLRYNFITCEDLKYHDLTEFKHLFHEIYGVSSKQNVIEEFLDNIQPMTNKLNSKIFILNFIIKTLNETYKENLTIEWVT